MIHQITFLTMAALLMGGCSSVQLEMRGTLTGDWKSPASSATLRFENGRISGSDGCNRYGTSYTASADTITISDKMMSTMMACESERMKNADQFRRSLIAAHRYRSDGKTLTLMEASGAVLAQFIPAGQ